MKTIIIGGVAAGTKTAAKLKRACPAEDVVIYTKSKDISYAGCGLPYFVGGAIEDPAELLVHTPASYGALTGVSVHTGCTATAVQPDAHTLTIQGPDGEETVPYDRLVIAVGAEPTVPPVAGTELDGVYTVRTPQDAVRIREKAKNAHTAVVVGGSFIGLEMAENLMKQGLSVTLIDLAPTLLPAAFDPDMADLIRRNLQDRGLRILLGTPLSAIRGTDHVESVVTASANLKTDLVVLAAGIRPATAFLNSSGLDMVKGCIVTDPSGRTNCPDIYAVGDCALVRNRLTGKPQWSAMGSTANIAGRALGATLGGTDTPYAGCLGTGVVRLSDDLNAARTGLSEEQARAAGYAVTTATTVAADKPAYYPGAGYFIIKLIADTETHRLLGAQILGAGAVNQMADIAVVGLSAGLKAEDFMTMDFAYAPPFSTAIHPFAVACTVLVNKLTGIMESFTPAEYAAGKAKDYTVVELNPTPTIPGAEAMKLTNPEELAARHKPDEKLLLVCARGRKAYLAQNKLKALGFTATRILEGGTTCSVVRLPRRAGKLSPADIKRVKGLGCLQDKRFDDIFNVRVITRNGRISVDEHRAIAEAAETFGSGMVTMTSRLTMEIQGVPYDRIDDLIAFLARYGLETGGTGSVVRPVVSCKGTTCQYGLIDTFALSEKIHERFYRGYHQVTLPHKFKIAVGGCPNNCVKPDLNDLGIIGQRVPAFDFEKCRGCKVCQVEKACPIKVASLADHVLHVDPDQCNGCGRCRGKCPFGVTETYTNGYKIYIGGRWGKKMANGRPLRKLFTSEEEVLDTVERAILFFRDEGITGERFADTVARLGFDYVEDKLLNAAIDKSVILEKTVKGGATC